MHNDPDSTERLRIPPELEKKMRLLARELRNDPTPTEDMLWQAIRRKQIDRRKFRRQVAIGAFVVDFYCSSEHLAVEVDGPIHDTQVEADKLRQEILETLGIRFFRVTSQQVERNLDDVLIKIRAAFHG